MKALLSIRVLAGSLLFGQQKEETVVPKEKEDKVISPAPPERAQVTHHELAMDGKTYKYSAVAGTLLIDGDDAKPNASVFYVAYTLDGVNDLRARPVTSYV